MVPTVEELSVFDGLMLSDGGLEKCVRGNARISFRLKYLSFAQAIVSHLPSFKWTISPRVPKPHPKTGRVYPGYELRSGNESWLSDQFYRWYPFGEKIVPRDTKIDLSSVLWWYYRDGSLHRKKTRPNYRRVIFCTDSFAVNDIEWLVGELSLLFGNNRIYREKNRLVIASNAMVRFANAFAAKSSIPEYEHKFEFGNYIDDDYFVNSYINRPIQLMNSYRKKYRVRELDYSKIIKDVVL